MTDIEYAPDCGDDNSEQWHEEMLLEERLIQEAKTALKDLAKHDPNMAFSLMLEVVESVEEWDMPIEELETVH